MNSERKSEIEVNPTKPKYASYGSTLYLSPSLPGQDEYDVVGGEPDEDAVGGALHLRPAEDEDGDEVAHEAEHAHAVQQDARQEELEHKVLGGNSVM